MKKIILFQIIWFSAFISWAQKITFYTDNFYPIADIDKYKPTYFSLTEKDGNDTKEMFFSLTDSALVRNRTTSIGNSGNLEIERTVNFTSGKHIKSEISKNLKSGNVTYKWFYESGELSRMKETNGPNIISEEYFDQEGLKIIKTKESKPEPNRGLAGWNEYLGRNLKYPKDARKNKIEGDVEISFTLSEKGEIKDIEVLNPKEVDIDLAQEAVRIIRSYPHKWTPLTLNGKPFETDISFPLRFRLGS